MTAHETTCPQCAAMKSDWTEDIRAIIREELDRKPSRWEAYARACIAYYEFDIGNTGWNTRTTKRALAEACEESETNATP